MEMTGIMSNGSVNTFHSTALCCPAISFLTLHLLISHHRSSRAIPDLLFNGFFFSFSAASKHCFCSSKAGLAIHSISREFLPSTPPPPPPPPGLDFLPRLLIYSPYPLGFTFIHSFSPPRGPPDHRRNTNSKSKVEELFFFFFF